MAVISFSESDSIGDVVDKLNDVSLSVGDLDLVNEDVTGSMVEAINNYVRQIAKFDDSAEQATVAKQALSAQDNGFHGSIDYNSNTGVLTFVGQSQALARGSLSGQNGLRFVDGTMLYDSGQIIVSYFEGGSITSSLYDSEITTDIINSAGTVVTTLRTPEI